jgi:hypothetical protein
MGVVPCWQRCAMDLVADVLQSRRQTRRSASLSAVPSKTLSLMACVAVHLALHEHCHARRPDGGVARTLQAKVLSIHDAGIDALKPRVEYEQARRANLVETLARYERVARD